MIPMLILNVLPQWPAKQTPELSLTAKTWCYREADVWGNVVFEETLATI